VAGDGLGVRGSNLLTDPVHGVVVDIETVVPLRETGRARRRPAPGTARRRRGGHSDEVQRHAVPHADLPVRPPCEIKGPAQRVIPHHAGFMSLIDKPLGHAFGPAQARFEARRDPLRLPPDVDALNAPTGMAQLAQAVR
jgi:hypothetical protein